MVLERSACGVEHHKNYDGPEEGLSLEETPESDSKSETTNFIKEINNQHYISRLMSEFQANIAIILCFTFSH